MVARSSQPDSSPARPDSQVNETSGLGAPVVVPRETAPVSLADGVRSLVAGRGLLAVLVGREVRIRYTQALLGVLWVLIQPLSLMLLFTVVFHGVLGVSDDRVPYPLFSYLALSIWTFLSNALSSASTSLIGNVQLVTKVYFPREMLTLASVLSAALDFILASGLFLVFLLAIGRPPSWTVVFIPLLFMTQLALGTGLSLALAALNVAYRDVRFVLPLALQIWMFASPIIYPIGGVHAYARVWFYLNPLAGLIESYTRVILLGQPPNFLQLMSAMLPSFALLWIGYRYFKKTEWRFADVI